MTFSSHGCPVLAPVAPGLFATLGVDEVVDLAPGIAYPVPDARPAVLALDGGREIVLHTGERATVTLDLEGPWIVDVEQTLMYAVTTGALLRKRAGAHGE